MNKSNSDGGNGFYFTKECTRSFLHSLYLFFFLSTTLTKGCSGKLGTCCPLRQSHDMASICALSPLAKWEDTCLSARAGSCFLQAGIVQVASARQHRDVCGLVAACNLEFLPRRSPANTMESMLSWPCHLTTPEGQAGFSSGLFWPNVNLHFKKHYYFEKYYY